MLKQEEDRKEKYIEIQEQNSQAFPKRKEKEGKGEAEKLILIFGVMFFKKESIEGTMPEKQMYQNISEVINPKKTKKPEADHHRTAQPKLSSSNNRTPEAVNIKESEK
ncbi:hypothetical protein BHYA_0261g00130 [Botrytis hyacinthi]|uniref:Uncharacterized protein n=1 Tax=Botrytis hyacinthi TaxID=278943 RepID=A0A4Z1G8C8_9HELO|nr:hypothetical protein BHYA_0261g00130 [Botrytis hyacinthi]